MVLYVVDLAEWLFSRSYPISGENVNHRKTSSILCSLRKHMYVMYSQTKAEIANGFPLKYIVAG